MNKSITGLIDIDKIIFDNLSTKDNISCVNKMMKNIVDEFKLKDKLKDILIENDVMHSIEKIYKIVDEGSCDNCGNGHTKLYFAKFKYERPYVFIDYWSGCMTYDPRFNIMYFDTFDNLQEYAQNKEKHEIFENDENIEIIPKDCASEYITNNQGFNIIYMDNSGNLQEYIQNENI